MSGVTLFVTCLTVMDRVDQQQVTAAGKASQPCGLLASKLLWCAHLAIGSRTSSTAGQPPLLPTCFTLPLSASEMYSPWGLRGSWWYRWQASPTVGVYTYGSTCMAVGIDALRHHRVVAATCMV